MRDDPIYVYPYHGAPAELQISINGGDEDWLAILPPVYKDNLPLWMDNHGPFGCSGIDQLAHPSKVLGDQGWTIVIGSHA